MFTTQTIVEVLNKLPESTEVPDVITHYKNGSVYISLEWYRSNTSLVDLSIGGEFGKGIIYEMVDEKTSYRHSYTPQQLIKSLEKLGFISK